VRGLLAFAASLLAGLAFVAPASADHAAPGTPLWGIEVSGDEEFPGADGNIRNYDIAADTAGPKCKPNPTNNGRGVAYDPVDGNLWYSFLHPPPEVGPFLGDGLIHKATPPSASNTCTSIGSIPFGDGPGGSIQDDIGAIDVDPDDANLWVAGHYPRDNGDGGDALFYKVDRSTGAILQSCSTPFAGLGGGNDTLAVAKLSGLSGSGKYLLTDAADESFGEPLLVLDTAACTGGAAVTPVTSYDLPPTKGGLTGIEYVQDRLITSTGLTIQNLGPPPFATSEASMMTGTFLEDITVPNPTVSGTKFDDRNDNGIRDAGEPGLAGIRVFVDYNGNGAFDAGEPSALTGADGSYRIFDFNPGSWAVREVPPAGSLCTVPANACRYFQSFGPADRVEGLDFGNFTPSAAAPQTGAARPKVGVAGVRSSGCVKSSFSVRVRVRAATSTRVRSVRITLDGKTIRRTSRSRFSVRINARRLKAGRHTLRIKATDANGRTRTVTRRFTRCRVRPKPRVSPRFTG
jgi:SdrD B-like protein